MTMLDLSVSLIWKPTSIAKSVDPVTLKFLQPRSGTKHWVLCTLGYRSLHFWLMHSNDVPSLKPYCTDKQTAMQVARTNPDLTLCIDDTPGCSKKKRKYRGQQTILTQLAKCLLRVKLFQLVQHCQRKLQNHALEQHGTCNE